MSISFSGLGSGMDYASWVEQLVAVREQSTITPLETKKTNLQSQSTALTTLKSTYSTLATKATSILDAKFGASMDIFAKSSVSLSNDKYFTVTASNNVPKVGFDVEVLELATSTNVKGNIQIESTSQVITEDTKLSELEGFSNGTFELRIKNTKDEDAENKTVTFELTSDQTVRDLIRAINQSEDASLSASLSDDGKFSIKATGENEELDYIYGTSGLKKALNLSKDSETNAFESKETIMTEGTNPFAVKLVEAGYLKEGTFEINGEIFTIDSKTTMNSLINDINTRKDAGVTAVYNSKTGTFSLSSTETGSSEIEIKEGTSDFISKTGLLDAQQTIGKDARFKINGEELTSSSNTVGYEDTGIYGLTLNLKATTVDEDGKNEVVNVSVSQDKDSVLSTIKEFIEAYNKVITETASNTATDGQLQYESALNTTRSSLRLLASSSYEDQTTYKTLSSIGISTGKAGASVSSDTTSLVIDETAFLEALENDPNEVKSLIIAFATEVDEITGKMTDSTDGYFKTKMDSIDDQITRLDEQIERKTLSLEAYEALITKQYQNMDSLIAKLNSQYTDFMSALS